MTAPPLLETRVEVETPEHVAFTYTIAGVGSRAAAAIIDYLYSLGILLAVTLVAQLAMRAVGRSMFDGSAPGWIFALLVMAQFAIGWGWYVLWEGLADGQTPGKRHLGLRVVQEGGYPVTFAASAVRNLVRAIDMQPAFSYGVAIVSITATRHGRRLGDIAAGTIVVQERAVSLLPPAAVAPREPGPPAAGTEVGTTPAHSAILTDDEYHVLERFVARRAALDPDRRARLVGDLAGRFRARVPDLAGSDGAVLLTLFERERAARATGVASRSDTGARREQHALVARGTDRWQKFAAMLDEARRRGLPKLSETEVSAFVAEYREVAADLARLRTAARGRDVDAVFYLSRLVAGAHNLFYRRQSIRARTALDYVALEVPREIRRSMRPILLAAALLFLPMVGTYLAVVRDPALGPQIMPAGFIDRAQTARARERRGEVYLPQDEARIRGPILASLLTSNNIRVSFGAFAGGITAGALTAWMLAFNGVSIGAAVGIFAVEDVQHLILGFMAPHGVFELSAICIAGGAGFLLAAAILLPGARTRREAFLANGRRAMHLMAATVLLLIAAGMIEGYLSPLPWPNEAKYYLSLLTAVLMLFWFTRGRGTRRS